MESIKFKGCLTLECSDVHGVGISTVASIGKMLEFKTENDEVKKIIENVTTLYDFYTKKIKHLADRCSYLDIQYLKIPDNVRVISEYFEENANVIESDSLNMLQVIEYDRFIEKIVLDDSEINILNDLIDYIDNEYVVKLNFYF